MEHLFVYGTLRPSLTSPELKSVVDRWRRIGAGYVNGRLYDLGEYPGAVLTSGADTQIIGEVFQLPDDGETLAALDDYEGFDPADSIASLFLRRKCEVTLEDNHRIECWVYEYNQPASQSAVIEEGDYLAVMKTRAGKNQ